MTHLDRLHTRVLCDVLVLIEAVLGGLSLPQANTQLDEKDHDRLQGGDRRVASTLGGHMVVEKLESTEVLVDGDEFLRALFGDGVSDDVVGAGLDAGADVP